MKHKILFTALLVLVLIVSCEDGGNLLVKEAAENLVAADPNVHSSYFQKSGEDGTIQPISYSNLPNNLVVPQKVEDMDVTKVVDCMNSTVEYVTIPSGVTVGGYCFGECENLNTVVLSEGVVYVEDSAFALCPALQMVVVNCSYSAVSTMAFMDDCTAQFEYNGHIYDGFANFMSLSL